jgi:hypothetical protein
MPREITPSPLDVLPVPGRRKCDTSEKRHTDKIRVTLAKNACVNRMVQLRSGLTTKAKVSENTKISREADEEFGLVEREINPENLRHRMYSGRAKFVAAMGPKSPFAGIEVQLLTVVLSCGQMRQLLSARKGLRLANSLIFGTFTNRN